MATSAIASSPVIPEDVVLLDVNGMRCAGCVSRVKEILESDNTVTGASVNLATETAVVKVLIPLDDTVLLYPSTKGSIATKQPANITTTTESRLTSTPSTLPGSLSQQHVLGTGDMPLDLEQQEYHNTNQDKLFAIGAHLAALLTSKGYAAQVRPGNGGSGASAKFLQAKREERTRRLRDTTRRLMVAWILASACAAHHIVHWFGAAVPAWAHFLVSTRGQAALSALALLGPGRHVVVEGLEALLRGAPNMNSLVGLGATAAFGISAVAAALPALGWPTFFEEPAMLLGVVLVGRALEERAKLRASADMAALSGLLPPRARLLLSDGTSWREVPSETVAVDDRVTVFPGDRIPVDGVVVSGKTTVDESALTGESLPVGKAKGDKITAGTLNYDGSLVVRATASGGDTAVADIVRLVDAAQARSAPIQRFADVVAGKFAYGVLGAAAATFVFWAVAGTKMFPQVLMPRYAATAAAATAAPLLLSLQLACNVLVVACPCALGLAAPTAVLVGTAAGARKGLLVRGGDVLEAASRVDTVIFDKTGTLTEGKPAVVNIWCCSDSKSGDQFDPEEIVKMAGAVEAASTHPIAKAIVQEARRISNTQAVSEQNSGHNAVHEKSLPSLLKVQDGTFVQEPGSGVAGRVHNRFVSVGSMEWVLQQTNAWRTMEQTIHSNGATSVDSDKRDDGELDHFHGGGGGVSTKPGHILVHVGIDDRLVGSIEISDGVRPDAASVICALKSSGIMPLMLSGDRPETAHAVGDALGLDPASIYAGIKPAGKAAVVKRLQKEGKCVAMVGDGINDAAALAQADVGIAMGGGVDAASEVADVVLLGDKVPQVLDVLQLSRATLSTIKQNMVWAFAYNCACIPLAAGALLPSLGVGLTPSLSGAMMGLSSLAVMANSLLLQHRVSRSALEQKSGIGGKKADVDGIMNASELVMKRV